MTTEQAVKEARARKILSGKRGACQWLSTKLGISMPDAARLIKPRKRRVAIPHAVGAGRWGH